LIKAPVLCVRYGLVEGFGVEDGAPAYGCGGWLADDGAVDVVPYGGAEGGQGVKHCMAVCSACERCAGFVDNFGSDFARPHCRLKVRAQ